jgi:hypothetical protein
MSDRNSDLERREAAVRVRAYLLWEEAGRPDDRDLELWLQAEREIARCSDLVDAFAGGSDVKIENKPFPRAVVKPPSCVVDSGAAGSVANGKPASATQLGRSKKLSGTGKNSARATTKRKAPAAPAPPAVDGATS